MRCGKYRIIAEAFIPNPVATRTNALWQSFRSVQTVSKISRRNPRECAVAKMGGYSDFFCCYVATRANALWQSRAIVMPEPETPKA